MTEAAAQGSRGLAEPQDAATSSRTASVPADTLLYAIGDIHGRLDLLDEIFRRIADEAGAFDARRRVLVFLGDYVDRGPDSAGVIDRLLFGLPDGYEGVYLKGNHEAIMLDFFNRPDRLNMWMHNGAGPTLESYGLDGCSFDRHRGDEAGCRDDLLAAIPEAHLAFLKGLSSSYAHGDYFFAHAGARPGVPLERQEPHDLIWIRDLFLYSDEDFGKIVVHGHTPVPEPEVRANRIGIDTGAWMTGRLTALRLYRDTRAFLMTEKGPSATP